MPRQPRCPTLTKPVSWPSRRRVLLTLQSSLLLIMMVAGRLQGQGVPVTRLEVRENHSSPFSYANSCELVQPMEPTPSAG